jgi:predicted ATPase with chaperone activity
VNRLAAALAPAVPDPVLPAAPPVPENVQDTGLSREAIADLLLKILYVQGARSGQQVVDFIRLPFPLVDERLLELQQARLVEVRSTRGTGRGGYIFDLTGSGRERAREAMTASHYVGAAPVPLEQYRAWVDRQSIRTVHVTRQRMEAAFAGMVLAPETLEMLGPAVNSAKSLFLYGEPGNGKSRIAETLAQLLGGALYLPYAVDIDGEIMVVYDPVYHSAVPDPAESGSGAADEPAWLRAAPEHDRRFAYVTRPVVITGGELTLEQLDLQYDTFTKLYQAPFQVKANGGVLIIDDFGRQRVPPRELLNRWIVPLEKRIDFLTLHTGSKFPMPFDCLLVLGTNLSPGDLVEEAFLRRIHYKLRVPGPTREEYEEIFRRCCAERGIRYEPRAVEQLYRDYYERRGIAPRGCHPRDILDHVCDLARYRQEAATLARDLLERSCSSYFLDLSERREPRSIPAGEPEES